MNLSAAASGSSASPARLVLVGVRGFGKVHAERIARLSDQGLVELVAAVDPGVALDPPTIYGVTCTPIWPRHCSAVGPVDVVIIAAPLGAHFQLSTIALRAGADVYLEKPPVASLDDFRSLLLHQQQTGRGSRLVSRARVARTRDAHRRRLGHRPSGQGQRSWCVVAHGRLLDTFPVWAAVATWAASPLSTASPRMRWRTLWSQPLPSSVAADWTRSSRWRLIYRANAIDSDDTSVVRIRTTQGFQVTCALTLCAPIDRGAASAHPRNARPCHLQLHR